MLAENNEYHLEQILTIVSTLCAKYGM